MVLMPGTNHFYLYIPTYLAHGGTKSMKTKDPIWYYGHQTLHIEFVLFLTPYLNDLCRNALLFSGPQISFPRSLLVLSFLLSPCSMRVILTCQMKALNIFISLLQGKHASGPIHLLQVAAPSPLRSHALHLSPNTFNSTRGWGKYFHFLPSCKGAWEPPMVHPA